MLLHDSKGISGEETWGNDKLEVPTNSLTDSALGNG